MFLIDNNNEMDNNINFHKLKNKLLVLKSINIQKTIIWCKKYNFEINTNF